MIASTLAKQLDTIEVKLPQAKGKTENRQSIAVTINENNRFFIDGERVNKKSIKSELLSLLAQKEEKVIILRAQKTVALEEVVYVMNIANENAIKVVLAVDAQ
jgi:biopolymer transport protein ExbD